MVPTRPEISADKTCTTKTRSILIVFIALHLYGCAAILRSQGLHPEFEPPHEITLPSARALIVTTSHDTLGDGGDPTGVFLSELTHPYYQFTDAQIQVDVASIEGGPIPVDPESYRFYIVTEQDERSQEDPVFQHKLRNSIPVTSVDPDRYDIIFLSGGWGAAYDLGQSEALGAVLTQARAHDKILGGVCHGPLGFLKAKDTDGRPLVEGKRMTAVTDKQLEELDIEITPLHPETELRKAGARFESKEAWRDFFANHVVVDGKLVTGQNQNAGAEVAWRMMEFLEKQRRNTNSATE